MKETNFIDQNKSKWSEFEELLKRKRKDPDKLSKLYIQITDDLSYSRTFYKNRSVRVYLNNLAQQVFQNIYKTRKVTGNAFVNFWRIDLPKSMWVCRWELYASFILFALSFIVGWVSAANDASFARAILGDAYVNMTIANIESGDPMAVYKEYKKTEMFLGITLNNLLVSILTFVTGIFAGLGTIIALISNGIMVGCFQQFFHERGLLQESFLTIWMHGTLEISAIIITGAAGFVVAKGVVFPGTYSRMQSLYIRGRHAIKIILGVIPIFIFAAFIEGFLTRYTEMPDVLRLCVIVFSAASVVTYFVWYPYIQSRHLKAEDDKISLPPSKERHVVFESMKSASEIFADAFVIFRNNLSLVIWSCVSIGTVAAIAAFIAFNNTTPIYFHSGWFEMMFLQFVDYLEDLIRLFTYEYRPMMGLVNFLAFTGMGLMSAFIVLKERGDYNQYSTGRAFIRFLMEHSLRVIFIGVLFTAILFITWDINWLIMLMALPFLLTALAISMLNKENVLSALLSSFKVVFGAFGKVIILYLSLLILTFLVSQLSTTTIFGFLSEMAGWFASEYEMRSYIISCVQLSTTYATLLVTIPIYLSCFAMIYTSQRETIDARGLLKGIESFGQRKEAYGMETE